MAHSTKGWEPSVAFPSIWVWAWQAHFITIPNQPPLVWVGADKVASSKVKPKSLHEKFRLPSPQASDSQVAFLWFIKKRETVCLLFFLVIKKAFFGSIFSFSFLLTQNIPSNRSVWSTEKVFLNLCLSLIILCHNYNAHTCPCITLHSRTAWDQALR